MKYLICFAVSMILCTGSLNAACALPAAGTRVWDIVNEDLVIDCETLSLISEIDSKVDGFNELLSSVDTIDSKADVIIDLDETILSKLETADSCCSQVDLILSEVEILQSKIDGGDSTSTFDEIVSIVDDIDSKIDFLDSPCAALPITSGGITISTPGVYCVTQDITGVITLNSSDITLDLNGHTLAGSVTTASAAPWQNLTIKNGIIMVPTGMVGVRIDGSVGNRAENMLLQDLVVDGGETGVLITEVSLVNISRVSAVRATLYNTSTEGVDRLFVEHSNFSEAASEGLRLLETTDFQIKNCTFNQNVNLGLDGVTDLTNGIIADCIFPGTLSGSSSGVVLNSSCNSILVTNCTAFNHSSAGFIIAGSDIDLTSCRSYNSTDGFLSSGQRVHFVECQSEANIRGFFLISALENSLSSCIAQLNANIGFATGSGSEQISFNACQSYNNQSFGFRLVDESRNITCHSCRSYGDQGGFSISSAENINLTDCWASNNVGDGFFIGADSQQIALIGCQAINNENAGILANGGTTSITLDMCVAVSNSIGFAFGNGGMTTEATVKECVATRNGSFGFLDNDDAGSASRYVACYANGNGSANYSPSGPPFDEVLATTPGISYWNNVYS